MGSALADWKEKFWNQNEDGSAVSKHWLGENLHTRNYSLLDYNEDEWDYDRGAPKVLPKFDPITLAKYQRAISNFVYILTQRNDIVVGYNSEVNTKKGRSFTDGKRIILSADIKKGKFDVAVGLALHEASHILYTDIGLVGNWVSDTIKALRLIYPHFISTYQSVLADFVMSVFNIIEDRYIDAKTYQQAPGYRGYYSALYVEYFGNDLVELGIKSANFRSIEPGSYLFHLLNIMHPSRDLLALPSLAKIAALIDLPNILRLDKTKARMNLSQTIVDIIANECENYLKQSKVQETNKPTPKKEKVGNQWGAGENIKEINKSLDGLFKEAILVVGNTSDEEDGTNEEDSVEVEADVEVGDDVNNEPVTLPSGKAKAVESLYNKQLNLLNGNIKKTKINDRSVAKLIEALAAADVDTVDVTDSLPDAINAPKSSMDTNVLVINEITLDMIDTTLGSAIGLNRQLARYTTDLIDSGIRDGRLLAKRLKFRTEDKVTVSSRLKAGKLDNRLLSGIGYGEYDIFKKISTDAYNESVVHISLDASGSMSGSKWRKAIKLAATLATASTIIPNLRVIVTFRSTTSLSHTGKARTPFIACLFDSKKDGITKIRSIFPCVGVSGGTPEGLTFAAIMKNLVKNSMNKDAYFINVCDGEPLYFNGYEHTKRQRKIIESHGIKVLAYYVSDDSYRTTLPRRFTEMYGSKNSFIVFQNNIGSIADSMNRKLLEK